MAVIAHPVTNPFTLKTATAVFLRDGATDSDDFSDHVGTLTLIPSSSSASWTAINGKTIQDNSISTWVAQLGLVQDLDENGFIRWLLAHEGEKAAATFTFKSGADPISIDVTLVPGQIGGPADGSIAVADVSMPCDGKPAFA